MTIQEALAVLDAGDADGVALVLMAEGIQGDGRLRRSCGCPVAKFVQAATGDETLRADLGHVCSANGAPLVRMPESVRWFIRCFDTGDYPELWAA